MNRFTATLLILTFFFLGCSKNGPAQQLAAELDKESEAYRIIIKGDKEIMGPYAQKILDGMPGYKELVSTELSNVKGLHINFIMKVHTAPDLTARQQSIVIQSETEVENLLNKLPVDIVGVEGFYTDVSSKTLAQTLRDLDQEFAPKHKPKSTEAQIWFQVADNLITNGALRYQRRHVGVTMVGVEIKNIYLFQTLCTLFLGRADVDPESKKVAYNRFMLAEWARNKMVIARFVNEMRRRGKTQGAIVMGLGHEEDFRRIVELIGLNATFHQTLPEDIRKEILP